MSKPARSRHRRWPFRLLPWLILLGGLALTWLLVAQIRRHETEMAQAEFSMRANEVVANLGRRMTAHALILRGVAGLFAVNPKLGREEFRRYVESLRLAEHYPGIQGIGYNQIVAARDKARHVAALREQGFPDYDILPPGERDPYSAVVYIEPFDWRNRRAFGYDVLAEPARMQAAARARDEGQAAMTGKLTLRQETAQDAQAGVLLFVPVYRAGAPVDTVEQRRAALVGWASSALRVQDLLQSYLRSQYAELSRQVAIRIYAGETLAPRAKLYDSHPGRESAPGTYAALRKATIHGAVWTARLEPLPAYWAGLSVDEGSRIVMVAGLAFSLAAAFAARAFASNHLRVAAALQETRRANLGLAEQEAFLRAIYDNSSVGLFLVDLEFVVIHANLYMARLFKCPLDSLVGVAYNSLAPVGERKLARLRLKKMLIDGTHIVNLEQHYRCLDGAEFWGQVSAQPFYDAEGQVVGIVGVIADITARRQMEEALRLSETRHRLLADNASDVIWTLDISGHVTYVSPSVQRLRACTVEQALRQPLEKWFTARSLVPALEAISQALEAVRTGEPLAQQSMELEQTREDGSAVWTETTISGCYDAKGRAVGLLGVTRDISERKQTQDRIARLAHYDPLTNLCNRALFFDRVEQALALARREKSKLALMYIDLDKFKPVNDSYGHPVGDRLLEQVAERMRGCVRASDTVGRIGGDEFVVLLPRLAAPADALVVAEKIRQAIREPYELAGRTLLISCSIGIAIHPEHGGVELDLSKNADIAMYRVKEAGGDNVKLYQPDLREGVAG